MNQSVTEVFVEQPLALPGSANNMESNAALTLQCEDPVLNI